MKNIKILIGIAFSIACSSQAVLAQVSYKISMMSDKKTYMVSMISEKTWTYPKNITSTAQVTIKVPSDKSFSPIVTSADKDVRWRANSLVEKPSSDPAHNYISFGLESLGTAKINYIAGQEIPLFTFVNKESNACLGKVSLINNVKDILKGDEGANYNIGNQITLLGRKGNSYLGNIQETVDCGSVTGNNDILNKETISIYPVPADQEIYLTWKNDNPKQAQAQILIENIQGSVVKTQTITLLNGTNDATINVAELVPGLYNIAIKQDKQISIRHKVIIIH
jgi:hypothetical protein